MSRAILRYSPDAAQVARDEDAVMLARLDALECGLPVADADAVFHFGSSDMFTTLLTPRRRELLERVMRQPMPSVRALSLALGRDCSNVHADVLLFEQHGLILRGSDGSLAVPFDEIKVEMTLTRAA